MAACRDSGAGGVPLGFFCGGTALCHLCHSRVSGGGVDALWAEAGFGGGGDIDDTGGMGGDPIDMGTEDGAMVGASACDSAVACDFFADWFQGDHVSAFSFFDALGF